MPFLCKNIVLADLLRSQHLLEMLQISLTFKNSEKVVTSSNSSKTFAMESSNFFSENRRDLF